MAGRVPVQSGSFTLELEGVPDTCLKALQFRGGGLPCLVRPANEQQQQFPVELHAWEPCKFTAIPLLVWAPSWVPANEQQQRFPLGATCQGTLQILEPLDLLNDRGGP